MERARWNEAESKWIYLTEDLERDLEASRLLVEKQKNKLDTKRKCSKEQKDAIEMAMEGHARLLEQYAGLEEKHINLLTSQRRIEDGILDVKKAAAKAGVKRLQAQLRDMAEAEAGELLVRLKDAEEAVAAAEISTSVFVTNFPDGYGAKDLWNTGKLYGHVVDVFIPDRRTKAAKRFDFVRFLNVLHIDRLINNLCTVWVGPNKIHANVARFQRETLHKQGNKVNKKGTNNVNHGAKGMTNSYAHVVKGNQVQNVGMEECPNVVLDETCLNHKDFSLCLLGKVKEFASND
nr:phragmoplast-associated kinesin-related protein [Tanacetum cinerariifolium]